MRSIVRFGLEVALLTKRPTGYVASKTQDVADIVGRTVRRNLSLDEWHSFIGAELPYERTCTNLPVHPSLFETAEKLVRADGIEGAAALLERAAELDPESDIDLEQQARRLAESAAQ